MSNIKNRHLHIKKIVLVSILAAMSFALFMFPKFPLLAAFPWLDMDLSDVPALLASVAVSPLAGLAVALIKNVIHLTVTSTAMVGELSNFLINGSFVFAVGLVYKYVMKKKDTMPAVAISVAAGTLVQLTVAVLVNYFIMIPMYSAFVDFEELGGARYYIIAGVIPFNFVKDVLAGLAFITMYKLLFRKLHGILVK